MKIGPKLMWRNFLLVGRVCLVRMNITIIKKAIIRHVSSHLVYYANRSHLYWFKLAGLLLGQIMPPDSRTIGLFQIHMNNGLKLYSTSILHGGRVAAGFALSIGQRTGNVAQCNWCADSTTRTRYICGPVFYWSCRQWIGSCMTLLCRR